MDDNLEKPVKTGVVAIVGPPNVGKSTLLNVYLGQKISIVTPKPQTTRKRILGIINSEDYQIVLIDTPGLHKARQPLNEEMVKAAVSSLKEVEVILFLIDVSLPLPEKNIKAITYLEDTSCPAILVLNKIDQLDKEDLLPIIDTYQKIYPFADIIPISALNSNGTDILLQKLLDYMHVGPRMYPEDIPTDATERFIAAEIIREKIFLFTGQEIPYSTAVMIESFKEDESKGLVSIQAKIIVEKSSQKGIIIGKKGSKLSQIGKSARHDIADMMEKKVFLKLWVKVQKNWTKDLRIIREMDS